MNKHELIDAVAAGTGESKASTGEGEYSTAKRTPIPRESEHEFHGKTNADSTAKRTGFPRESEQ